MRVEPTGEAVIAGRAQPGVSVDIRAGDRLVARAQADADGTWVAVPEAPLSPGSHDLSLQAEGKSGAQTSQERVAVAVPAKPHDGVLVVIDKAGAPSRVLAAPDALDTSQPRGIAGTEASAEATATAAAEPGSSPALMVEAAEGGALPSNTSRQSDIADAGMAEPGAAAAARAGANPALTVEAVGAEGGTPGADASQPLEIARAEAVAEPGASAAARADASPVLSVEAVEAEGGTLYVAGAGEPDRLVRVYVDNIHVGDAKAGPGRRWLLESRTNLPSEKVTLTIRADALRAGGGPVEARAQVPFVRRLDAAALVPAAAVAAGSRADLSAGPLPEPNAVIIRRGDNLWTISRRAYGRGMRYTTIYGANSDQIRNPDRIYPGQVLVMPTGDRAWTE